MGQDQVSEERLRQARRFLWTRFTQVGSGGVLLGAGAMILISGWLRPWNGVAGMGLGLLMILGGACGAWRDAHPFPVKWWEWALAIVLPTLWTIYVLLGLFGGR
jgi:hypothetical protein